MKQKKSVIILASVLAVCVLGIVLSKLIDWPIDFSQSSGNISKSTRFSRKTAEEGASLMQELILSDEDYKNSIVTAYLVMNTRVNQFNALVDMSSEVAGKIKEFDAVLKDMKKAQPMINNVVVSMKAAGTDLNDVLGGEDSKTLAQNTNNAALAYSTLQKQNSLATRFIETTDEYLKSHSGDDRLKFVRDQWVDYQHMTAFLEDDAQATADLKSKGHLLTAEVSAKALKMFDDNNIVDIVDAAELAEIAGVTTIFSESPEVARILFSGDGITDLKSGDGITDLKIGDGITDLKSGDGITDLKRGDGITDLKSGDGITDLKSGDGITSLKSGDGITTLKSGDGITTLRGIGDLNNLHHSAGEIFFKNGDGVSTVFSNAGGVTTVIKGLAEGTNIDLSHSGGHQEVL